MDTELSEQQWKQVSRVLDYIRSFPKASTKGTEEPKTELHCKHSRRRSAHAKEACQPTYKQLRLFEEVRHAKQ
jgi:hypothetical protein